MPTPITSESAKALLIDALEERGADYVYPKEEYSGLCFYFDTDGAPSCLVGAVLAKAGYTYEDLADDNELGVEELDPVIFSDDDLLIAALSRAQIAQDTGRPWGEAVAAAVNVLENGFDPLDE